MYMLIICMYFRAINTAANLSLALSVKKTLSAQLGAIEEVEEEKTI